MTTSPTLTMGCVMSRRYQRPTVADRERRAKEARRRRGVARWMQENKYGEFADKDSPSELARAKALADHRAREAERLAAEDIPL